MRIRGVLHSFRENDTRFGSWIKINNKNQDQTIFDVSSTKVKYVNLTARQSIEINFDNVEGMLSFYAAKLGHEQLIRLRDAIEDEVDSEDSDSSEEFSMLQWQWEYQTRNSIDEDKAGYGKKNVYALTLNTQNVNDQKQLLLAIKVIAKFAIFPASMIKDITQEISWICEESHTHKLSCNR